MCLLYVNTCHVSVGQFPSLVYCLEPFSYLWIAESSCRIAKRLSETQAPFYRFPRLLSGHWDSTTESPSLWVSGWCWTCQNSSGRIPKEGGSQEQHYHQLIVLKWNTDFKLICFVLALVPFSTHAWNSLQLYPGPFFTRGIQHLDRENWILNR